MDKKFLDKHFAISEVISTLLLLVISIIGASILAIFINNFFDAGLFSHTDINNPQNLFLIGYDTRDGKELFGIAAVNNDCSFTTICHNIYLRGGEEYIVLAIENRGTSSVQINNVFINEIPHSWDSETNQKTIGQTTTPIAGKFSVIANLQNNLQITPEIPSGKVGYFVVKLNTALGILENKKLVNLRVDEKGIDSQKFVIRIGVAT